MPTYLGNKTKAIFLNTESHKLALEFEAIGKIGVITVSADLVAADVVATTINGQTATVTWGTSHLATMTALAVAIKALSGVSYAKVHGATSRIISFLMADDSVIPVITNTSVTNGGAGTATVITSVMDATINIGTPVILIGVGEKVAPAALYDHFGLTSAIVNLIGISMHSPGPGELLTVIMKGYAVIFAQASSGVAVGPVDYSGHDSTTGYDTYITGTSSALGFALDAGSDGDVIRVLLCK
jgi:hypothetical protein